MLPTLPPGTNVVGLRWFRTLKPGQVIVFKRNGRELIKRIDKTDARRLFVLGDYAQASTDSRDYGPIDEDTVLGVVIWPLASRLRQTDN
jgi:type IV secretory pathway protease TraF